MCHQQAKTNIHSHTRRKTPKTKPDVAGIKVAYPDGLLHRLDPLRPQLQKLAGRWKRQELLAGNLNTNFLWSARTEGRGYLKKVCA